MIFILTASNQDVKERSQNGPTNLLPFQPKWKSWPSSESQSQRLLALTSSCLPSAGWKSTRQKAPVRLIYTCWQPIKLGGHSSWALASHFPSPSSPFVEKKRPEALLVKTISAKFDCFQTISEPSKKGRFASEIRALWAQRFDNKCAGVQNCQYRRGRGGVGTIFSYACWGLILSSCS